MKGLLKYLLIGTYFGFVLVKSEVVSWYRIQEMFRFQSFFMYGIIALAIAVGFISIRLIKKFNVKDAEGRPISVPPKDKSQFWRYSIGGTLFGIGWALLGACPGPVFSLIGSGLLIFLVPAASAVLGTWVYGRLRHKLPH